MKGSWTVGSCDANALLDLQPTSATVPAGTTKQFNAYLDAPPILNNNGVTWQLTGVGSISSTGVYSAPSAAPTTSQSATVKATYTKTVSGCGSSDVTKTSTVTIPAACAVQSLVVTPNILYNIYPGAPPIQFQAFANGSTVPLASGITWTSSAPTYASINSTGIMTLGQVANQLQIVTITATSTCGGVSATAQVQLSYFPIPQGAQLTPNSGYGAGQQFLFTRGTQPPNPVDGTITDILYSSDLSVTTNACYIVYAYGGLQLRDNTGGYSSFAPGNNNSQLPTGNPPPSHLSGSAVNSQCTLNYYDAFTLSTFVERWWNIPLVFNHSFAGPRKIYVRVGQDSPFVQVGGWNVP